MSQLLSADQHPKAPPTEDRARARIIAAACSHFFALGFRGVTMDDLAAELGMSKKTLYASFSGKNDLLRAVLLDKSRSIEADLERISVHSGADVMVALRELLSCAQRYTQEIQPPFVRDIGREGPEMFELVQSRRRDAIQRYFRRLFDNGRRTGIFRKDIPAPIIIEMLLSATEAIINPTTMSQLGLTANEGFTLVITVILEGVFTGRRRLAKWRFNPSPPSK